MYKRQVFDSLSRMSGDAKEGFAAYEELYQKGVNLVYLKEPHINTETYKKALENNIQLTGSNVDYILEAVSYTHLPSSGAHAHFQRYGTEHR